MSNHVIYVPSIQKNRIYPVPNDGIYAANEGDFAEWFCGTKLVPMTKAQGISCSMALATYVPGDDLGPLYKLRTSLVAQVTVNPGTHYYIVSIHTEGTVVSQPNLFGGRYYGAASQKLLSNISDALAKVHPVGARRFEYDSPSYILLDGYPSNCTCAIVEVAGDSTVAHVQFLSKSADNLAKAVVAGIGITMGPMPIPDYKVLYEEALITIQGLQSDLDQAQGQLTNINNWTEAFAKKVYDEAIGD
jgi:hypothetical protein